MAIQLLRPVAKQFAISQRFGEHLLNYSPLLGHPGVDFDCPENTPIVSSADGKVFVKENNTSGNYGCSLRIQHSFGYTIYAHLNDYRVNLGDTVRAGQVIGISGGRPGNPCCGRSTGPHLHWGLRLDGVHNAGYSDWVDPLPYMVETLPPLAKVEWVEQKMLLRKGWHLTCRARFRNISASTLTNLRLCVRKDPAVVSAGLSPSPIGIIGGSMLKSTYWLTDYAAGQCASVAPGQVGEFVIDLFAGDQTFTGRTYREDFGIADSEGKWLESYNVWFQVEVL